MKTLLRLAILVLLAAVSMAAGAREPGSKVGVSFDRTRIDIGTVRRDAGPVHMEFTMVNHSQQPVAILSARASCGCTTPEAQARPVMPGDSTVIKVNFITSSQSGEIAKEVTLKLRRADGKSEKVNLEFSGVVVPEP